MDPAVPALVEELAASRGVTLSALSRMVGRNVAYLQQFVRRGTPRVLPERERRILADFFGVDEAMLGGSPRDDADVRVPYLTVHASAGAGAAVAGERVIRTERIGRDMLRRAGVTPKDASVIGVTGDSMAPTLASGDRVVVDGADRRVRDHAIFVVRHDDMLWIKRLAAAPGGLRLLSDNPSYAPVEVALRDAVVVGRAKLLLRDL